MLLALVTTEEYEWVQSIPMSDTFFLKIEMSYITPFLQMQLKVHLTIHDQWIRYLGEGCHETPFYAQSLNVVV
ncbi:hypothetical protein POVCU2_0002090 [Plasmodium ovale curtisi]|uniref:Uncharacterized protein n=1 Tax=Plasmodium ovale curtisi TaxID=864141 RepID=A0A1A8VHW7_PLAOA|nr:hypothetical protein POVCU2_0002090 [Plasmodium ovale curtisi]SBS80607.1 hypothetical protein POVCU1_001900 [Plasmodium ovale curtisi]